MLHKCGYPLVCGDFVAIEEALLYSHNCVTLSLLKMHHSLSGILRMVFCCNLVALFVNVTLMWLYQPLYWSNVVIRLKDQRKSNKEGPSNV